MKKKLLIIGGLSFLLVACGGGEESSEVAVSSSELVESSIENQSSDTQESSSNTNDVKEYEDKIKELEEQISQLEDENTKLSKSIEDMSDESSEVIEKPVEKPSKEPNIGKRLNPFEFGDSMILSGEDFFGNEFDLTLNLSNLITGEEAINRMMSENIFNEIGENEEVIFFDAELILNKYKSVNDDPYYTSTYMFRYYRDDYSEYKSDNFVSYGNEFGGQMYEGGSQSGSVALIRPAGESGYIVFEDETWIKLP